MVIAHIKITEEMPTLIMGCKTGSSTILTIGRFQEEKLNRREPI